VSGNVCVVIEDADSGIQAARTAGVKGVIGIRIPTRNQSLEGADIVVDDLSGVNTDTLRRLVD
jgi:beta-phosphoglucomutase-like phosphatase (HAD superfamily)